jgi:hypothetical protein
MEKFIREYRRMLKRQLNHHHMVENARTLNPLTKLPRVLDKDLKAINNLARKYGQKDYHDMLTVLRHMNSHTRNEAGRHYMKLISASETEKRR